MRLQRRKRQSARREKWEGANAGETYRIATTYWEKRRKESKKEGQIGQLLEVESDTCSEINIGDTKVVEW